MVSRIGVPALLISFFLIGCGQSEAPVEVTVEVDPMTAFGTTASN